MNKKVLALLFSLVFLTGEIWAQTENIAPGVNDSLLIVYLRNNYYPTTPRGYNAARDSMYSYLDVDETDSLTCVYSGLRAKADGSRTPSNGSLSFNTEHSWPQSFYDEEEPMRGDIHHLFPTWSSPNQSRSNHPFAEIDDNVTTSWWYWKNGGSVSGIPSEEIDEYSEYGNSMFEPREDHKGNVARAMFYFWTVYQTNNDILTDAFDNEAFFEGMKETLYQWHKQDPPDAVELARSLGIESIQGNRNPFIHDTSLVRRAYFYTEPVDSVETFANVYISEVYEPAGGTAKYIELFNADTHDVNFDAGDWALLRYSNANTTPQSVPLNGSIPAKDFFVIGDDNTSTGVQTVFGAGLVDQDDSDINHNGNDKYVLVKNASTTADTVDSFGKDNIGNSAPFAENQVAYRLFSELPNDGSFAQQSTSPDAAIVASGYWQVFDVSNGNSNAALIATPGYSKGIESSEKAEAMISGNAGWRLISIPAQAPSLNDIADNTAIQGIESTSSQNVFTWNSNGMYDSPTSLDEVLEPGEGLAVYFFDNAELGSSELPLSLDTEGDEPSADVMVNLNTATITTGSYFTLAGNPFQSNFDAGAITSDNPVQANIHLVEDGLYYPVNRFSSVLLPWQGFWVESSTSNPAAELSFPVSGKTTSNATVRAYSKDLLTGGDIQFYLTSETSTDRGCRISFGADFKREWDLYDASKLTPSASEYAILGCRIEERVQSVVSLPLEEEELFEIDLITESINVGEQLELSWEFNSEAPEGWEFSLADNINETVIDLKEERALYFLQDASSQKRDSSLRPEIVFSDSENFPRFTLRIEPVSASSKGEEHNSISEFRLNQNYPNPFNPVTVISFQLPVSNMVKLEVFDIIGQKVATLINGEIKSAGHHSVDWNASNKPSGLYYARLTSRGVSQTIKMLLVK